MGSRRGSDAADGQQDAWACRSHEAALRLRPRRRGGRRSYASTGEPVRATRSIAATSCRAMPGSCELCPASSTIA